MLNFYAIMEIRDRIQDAYTYYNFCDVHNLPWNKTHDLVFTFTEHVTINMFPIYFLKNFKSKIDWDNLIVNYQIKEEILREFINEINSDAISIYQKLSEKFMTDFKTLLNWNLLAIHQKMSKDFIIEHEEFIQDWSLIFLNQEFNDVIFKKYNHLPDWEYISQKTEERRYDLIEKYKHYLVWEIISTFDFVADFNFIERYKRFIDWEIFSTNMYLTKDIIIEYIEHFDINILLTQNFVCEEVLKYIVQHYHPIYTNTIIIYQMLSENFLRFLIDVSTEYEKDTLFDLISEFQTLSESFIYDFYDKINWSLRDNNIHHDDEYFDYNEIFDLY